MANNMRAAQDYFRTILLTVVGQAFDAAGYALEDRPTTWAGGLFRFARQFESGLYGFIEFQHLPYPEPMPSRFTVTLIRSDQPHSLQHSTHPLFVRRALSRLVVDDFGVAILPSADHWWSYGNLDEMGRALGEAGSLAVAYGMPWLAGDLEPPVG